MNQQSNYAGFWKRFLAHFIDKIIIGLLSSILIIPVMLIFFLGVFNIDEIDSYQFSSYAYPRDFGNLSHSELLMIIFLLLAVIVLSFIINWLYYAFFESSSRQATPGKMILNLKVTDLTGQRIGFGRASGRYFGKILSGLIIYIGYIMAAFTERKQALHDILAGTLIIDKSIYIHGITEHEKKL